MPSRKRKSRQRNNKQRSNEAAADGLSTLKRLLPPPATILRLPEFLRQYAPCLETTTASGQFQHEIILSPLESIKPALRLKTAACREPVPSIVDDVVWALVQHRDRCKHSKKDGRNVLAQGFSSLPPDEYPSFRQSMALPTSRPELTQFHANHNVTFCKTSTMFRQLHSHVGDEIIRMILLHTRLFVPICTGDSSAGAEGGNFRLVCGPPLTKGPISQLYLASTSTKRKTCSQGSSSSSVHPKSRPTKKRRRRHAIVPSTLQSNQSLSRYNLFYSDSFTPKIGLPHKHPFYDDSMTPEKLLVAMTVLSKRKNGVQWRKRWRRLRVAGVSICRKILDSAKKCDYPRILEHYCPLPNFNGENAPGDDKEALQFLVQCYSPPERVASFVKSVLCRVFPPEFWGSPHNFDCILGAVQAFVLLRRKERLSNKRLVHGVRITHITWLQGQESQHSKKRLSRTSHELTSRLTLLLFRWLFRSVIIPLLRANFYVTETEFSAKKVFYYRKPVWSAFRSLSLRKLMKAQYQELTKQEIVKCLSSNRMGFSHLRLLPKATGVRPIAQLSRGANQNLNELLRVCKNARMGTSGDAIANHTNMESICARASHESTNSILANVFDVLTYECGQHDEPFGSGLQGLHDFYPRYRRYITALKRESPEARPLNLVFATVDIEKCYDSIDQNYMFDVASRQLCHDDYVVQKYHLLYGDEITGSVRRATKRAVGPPECQGLFLEGDVASKFRNVVLDSRTCQMVQRQTMLKLLKEHVKGHLVVTSGRYEQRYFLQTGGIPQGSVLSMLLCNIYYGNIENLMLNKENPQSPRLTSAGLSDTPPNQDFMARQVDDFLFISASKSAASNFLGRMWAGRPELGVRINQEKSLVSEEIPIQFVNQEDESSASARIPIASSRGSFTGKLFPWCGMLFDTRFGEVYLDYERFQGEEAKNSLTVDSVGGEGRKLASRMQSYARPRCLPILFDVSINSRKTIITNYYQMMLYSAAKTAEHLRSTDVHPTVAVNESYVICSIDSLAAFSGRQIRCNLSHQGSRTMMLDDAMLLWLTWHAFSTVFGNLHGFASMSRRIDSKLTPCIPPSTSPDLEAIIADAYHRFSLDKIIELK